METPFKVGESFFFRLVTYHLVGRVVGQTGKFVELSDAAWIPVSSRFMNFLREGVINEAEPITGPAYFNIDAVVDAFQWRHVLPLSQK